MESAQIRKVFLDFFKALGHQELPSSPLVAAGDDSLLFTNSGMVQFKDIFLGEEQAKYSKVVTVQRCLRTGGKHNDLENVGYTARHHTFFEMLGNFSFGDYFKEEAISFAYTLLIDKFSIPKEKLWITIYVDDEDSFNIWRDVIGISEDRIIRIEGSDNFWQMGDTGPCGPCTEIFYDHGDDVPGGIPGSENEDGDRFIEIWNLVFMEYERHDDGVMTALPTPCVDTGMGLERIAAVLQHVHSNYDIDIFQSLIKFTAETLNVDDLDNKSLRVISDHIRSISFLIVDGVRPSNEGGGYLLRRLIRRAVRHGYKLGCQRAFLHCLLPALIDQMGASYPELIEKQNVIKDILERENIIFLETLTKGMRLLVKELDKVNGDVVSGETLFLMYDTYGFPFDLTADVAREYNLGVDVEGFEKLMDQQRLRARKKKSFKKIRQEVIEGVNQTVFKGYEHYTSNTVIKKILVEMEHRDSLKKGDSGVVILEETPFYAESGGQVGDRGVILTESGRFIVRNTKYFAHQVVAHYGEIEDGQLNLGDLATATIDSNHRELTMRHHSATHLLHAALKKTLGQHIQQKGSLVDAEHLRFDFSHHKVLSDYEIKKVENIVNDAVFQNINVETLSLPIAEAKAAGAEALFTEKYGEVVRVIKMGALSLELCGGTHVNTTGQLGLFKITAEKNVASGVRRIEGVCSSAAVQYVNQNLDQLSTLNQLLNTSNQKIVDRVRAIVSKQNEMKMEVQTLMAKMQSQKSKNIKKEIIELQGTTVQWLRADGIDRKAFKTLVDQAQAEHKSGLVILGGLYNNKVFLCIKSIEPYLKKWPANELLNELCQIIDGRGGGNSSFAQGAGDNVGALDRCMEVAFSWVRNKLKSKNN